MTVVIFAQLADSPVDAMVRELAARDVPVFRADTSWFPRQLALDARLSDDGRWTGQLSTAYRAVDLGAIRSIWYAVCAVPRHEFVPDVFRQDRLDQYDETWRQLDTTTEQSRQEWLDQVYSNTALITALDRTTGSPSLLSTSSMPGLMTRMLEPSTSTTGTGCWRSVPAPATTRACSPSGSGTPMCSRWTLNRT